MRQPGTLGLSAAAIALVAVSAGAVHADWPSRMQYGLATEHAGLGVGREFGAGDTTVVLGIGTELAIGYSSVEGWIGAFAPGGGVGVRRHFRGLYVGPTIGANYTLWSSELTPANYARPWLMLDLGHRWDRDGHDHSFKLGLALGIMDHDGEWRSTGMFTIAWTR